MKRKKLFDLYAFAARLALLMVFCTPILAQAFTGITIVMSAPTQSNLTFVEDFKRELTNSKNAALKVKVIDLAETEDLVVAENSELVIALGVKALEFSSKLKFTTPVLGVFTPLPAFNLIMEKSGRELGSFSAIVLDQPYSRQMALIKAMLPESRKVGVLLGNASNRYADALKESVENSGLQIRIESLQQETELIPKLNRVLQTTDALLAIPDPMIYNREAVQPILLTSYRYQKPVFGFSPSYVKAGALAAVYSTTAQLARQAMEIIGKSHQSRNMLLPPQAPKYFSVSINQQVARSLNIAPLTESAVEKALLQQESAP